MNRRYNHILRKALYQVAVKGVLLKKASRYGKHGLTRMAVLITLMKIQDSVL